MGTEKETKSQVEEQETQAEDTAAQTEETTQEDSTEETAAEETAETAEEPKEKTPEEQLAEMNDKYVRLYSEFDNFRRRTSKEKMDIIRNASGDVIKELLPILDDFDRAIKANEASEDVEGLKEGFKLIHQKLYNSLERKGLKPMDANGKEFNVDHHEAITEIPAPSEDMKGKVVDAIEKGYFLNDRVLRFAKVVVGK